MDRHLARFPEWVDRPVCPIELKEGPASPGKTRKRRARRPGASLVYPWGGKRSAVDRGADGLELRRSRLAEERHGDDAHHGDEGDEEGVLHEGGAALVLTEAGTEVGGEEF